MAEKTPQEILDDLHAAQKEAKKAGLIDQREKTDAVINEAESAKAQANKGAGTDYNNYQKKNAGKSETSGMYAYNAYRSRLSAAAKAAQDAKEKADLSYDMTEANANANLKNAQAAEQALRNDQHWQQKQWEYQLAADEAAKQGSSRSYSTVSSGWGVDLEDDTSRLLSKSIGFAKGIRNFTGGTGQTSLSEKREAEKQLKVFDKTKDVIDETTQRYKKGEIDLNEWYRRIYQMTLSDAKRKGLSQSYLNELKQYSNDSI